MATILIVDDRPTNRDFLVTLLGYAGHRLLEAGDGKEALGLVRAERPDLAIVDIVMPTMDGYEFARQLRADPHIAQTRVIFYTATYLETEARQLAHACGVAYVLAKPSEPEVLLDTVNTALNLSKPAFTPPSSEEFAREHLHLLTNKLSQKVDELEAVNIQLEQRVQTRTAELAAANAHLRELNRLKDEFLAITSHDLRSPLGGIRMMAEVLRRLGDSCPVEKRHDFLRKIANTADHLIALVSDLLNLAKIEAGHVQCNLSEYQVSDIVRRSIEALAFNANAKDIGVQLAIAPGEPFVQADGLKLLQVFNNLLSNAIKFTPQGGQVTLTIQPEPDGVQVGVSDTGRGIPPEDLPHIFEKFKQGRTRNTAYEEGTGLGLTIVRQLVALHGGRVEVTSAVDRGSTFTVHLPQRPPDLEQVSGEDTGTPPLTARLLI